MIVVEKSAQTYTTGSSFGMGASTSVIPGDKWTFDADHWHEIPRGEFSTPFLEIVDLNGFVIAKFHSWDRVYYKESLVG